MDDDRLSKVRGVRAIEAELAGLLVQTPYVLLLGIPRMNVVSAALSEFAGEMGPIEQVWKGPCHHGTSRLVSLSLPSDHVDYPDGQLVRCANRNLRRIMMIADDLVKCNDHFRVFGTGWRLHGRDARAVRVQVAGRFSRIAYQMVAGREAYRHPCCQRPDYILKKLLVFRTDNEISYEYLMINPMPRWPNLHHTQYR